MVHVSQEVPTMVRYEVSPKTREARMATILFVRVKSDLPAEELERRIEERRSRFLAVPGLIQKIYGRDDSTGHYCGIYFFESSEALARFRESDLARTIGAAYEAVEVRPEAYEVLFPLRPEVGPFETLGGDTSPERR